MPNALSFNTAQAWKGIASSNIGPNGVPKYGTDIYGTRQGKGQLQKDPTFFPRDDTANITSMTTLI